MKKQPKYARVGEKVRILVPKEFDRCGYPLTMFDVAEKFRDEIRVKMETVRQALGMNAELDVWTNRSHFDMHLEKALCSLILNREGFGGKERSVYERDLNDHDWEPKLTNREAVVLGRKRVQTGTRVPGSGGYSYDGDYDYDPPYLENMKVHCVYTLDIGTGGRKQPFQILANNCEVIR